MPLRRRDGTKTDVCGFKFSLNKEVLCFLSLNLGYMNIYTFIIITIQKAKKNETNRNSCKVDRNYKMSKSFLTDDFRPRKILYSVRISLQ